MGFGVFTLPAIALTVALWRKGRVKTVAVLFPQILPFPLAMTFIFGVLWFLESERKFFTSKHMGVCQLHSESPLDEDDIGIVKKWREDVNNMGLALFNHYKQFRVVPTERIATDVSRGAGRMRDIFKEIPPPEKLNSIVEFGVGRGGWTQTISNRIDFSEYDAYSLWRQPGQEKLEFHHNRINFHSTDMHHVPPREVDGLFADAGENHPNWNIEIQKTYENIRVYDRWISPRLKYFCIRIPNPFDSGVIHYLKKWQRVLKSGQILRLQDERNSVPVCYFVPGSGDIDHQLKAIAEILVSRQSEAEEVPPDKRSTKSSSVRKAFWQQVPDLPVPKLPMKNLSKSLPEKMNKPRNETDFMKELGWIEGGKKGSTGTSYNRYVYKIIKPIAGLFEDFGLWQVTSTTPQATFKTVLAKIDKAPQENHDHHTRIWESYRAIAAYLRKKGCRMRRLDDLELVASVNKDGAMGYQEDHLGYATIGDYVKDKFVWKPRLQSYATALRANRPILSIYNSIGKKERKRKDSSRLIWFLPATARLFEAQTLGHYDSILKKLPQSISGMPLYDYGDTLANILQGRSAVCDDIAGWDTKVSYSLLCMESEFLMSLTEDEELKKDIRHMYQIYAYPTVRITRPRPGGMEDAFFQLQGQVASGRRVTYAMNTTTNVAVTLSRAAYSQGISVENMFEWALDKLNKGHSDAYGGKISGDDSVIIMSQENAAKYAGPEGVKFTNDIGMPRKDRPANMPSPVFTRMEEIDFCSHTYAQVFFYDKGDKACSKWMPTRSVSEIMAKATIPTKHYISLEQQAAWARAQGLNLIVNYFHIPSVRMAAKAILNATPSNLDMSVLQKGWKHRITPWITNDGVIDIINGCLFGHSSTYPKDYRVTSLYDMGYVTRTQRGSVDVNWTSKVYKRWKESLEYMVEGMRRDAPQEWKFDDSIGKDPHLNEIKRFAFDNYL